MNYIIQNILAFSTLLLAVAFLAKKFILPKRKSSKNCASAGCGCN